MIIQIYDITLANFLMPLLAMMIMIFTVIFAIYTYTKIRKLWIMLILWFASVVFSLNSMNIPYFPFTPYFQIFYALIMTGFFIVLAYEAQTHPIKVTKKKRGD